MNQKPEPEDLYKNHVTWNEDEWSSFMSWLEPKSYETYLLNGWILRFFPFFFSGNCQTKNKGFQKSDELSDFHFETEGLKLETYHKHIYIYIYLYNFQIYLNSYLFTSQLLKGFSWLLKQGNAPNPMRNSSDVCSQRWWVGSRLDVPHPCSIRVPCKIYPIGSMYGRFTYIYHKNQPNEGEYTIHGWYRYCINI